MTTLKPNSVYNLKYLVCRNISSPEDERAGRKVYAGQVPASSVLDLEDNENVREYLVDAKGKQKRSPTLVHQAIRKTLRDTTDQFNILNGGMVLVARGAVVDDANRSIRLQNPSIINGSQTQGELRRFFEAMSETGVLDPSVKFELIVTEDDDLIAEISIARNFQNDVRPISIAGRRGQLDGLETAVKRLIPDASLRKSESDLVSDSDYLDTEKLIQVIFALLPSDMMKKIDIRAEHGNKVFAYSQKTRCLKLFQKLVEDGPEDVYKCFLDLAPLAWQLYVAWKSHQGFQGTRLRSIVRDDNGIADVPDGIIFPILAAHSAFVKQLASGHWVVTRPKAFSDTELIETAKQTYMDVAQSNPQTMGKSKACYTTLLQITSIYAKLGS